MDPVPDRSSQPRGRIASRVALGLTIVLAGTLPLKAAAQSTAPTPPRGYVSVRARAPIAVDGRLDDPSWRDAPWSDSFVDIEGDLKPRPRFATRMKMLWDDQYLYIAAELKEPHVWGTITKHDAVIFQDNDFEVFIDPDGDNHQYYEFEINALNTGWDLFLQRPYRDGGPAVDAWEIPGLKTGVQVQGTLNDPSDRDTGWTVELAFPWKALGEYAHRPVPPRDGDQWRINFSRVEWEHQVDGKTYKKVAGKREDNWVWSPQGVIDMHRPERWGIVQFSTEAPGKAQFRPDPSGPVRDRLMAIYHAQKAYQAKHRGWSTRLEDLDLPPYAMPPDAPRPIIRRAGDSGYEASITVEPADGRPRQTWTIRQDSRIAVTPGS